MEENEKINDEVIFKDCVDNRYNYVHGEFYNPDSISSIDQHLDQINKKREELYLYLKSLERIKLYILIAFLAFFLAGAVMLIVNPELINSLFTLLIIVFVVFLLVIYGVVKSIKKKKTSAYSNYLKDYSLQMNTYCYYQTGISSLEFSSKGIVDQEMIEKIACYENIKSTKTRDVVIGKMFGIGFISFDCLISEEVENKKSNLFSGKMFHIDLYPQNDQDLILYLKGCGDSYPTELKGKNEIKIKNLNDSFKAFSSSSKNDLLNQKAIEVINKITINDHIEDVIISFNKNGIYFGLSYCSSDMIVPFKENIKKERMENLKNDVELILEFVSKIANSKSFTK